MSRWQSKTHQTRWAPTLIWLATAAGVWLVATLFGRWANGASRTLARLCSSLVARLTRLLPFALAEILLIAALVALFAFPLWGLRRGGAKGLGVGLCRVVALAMTLVACMTLLWGVNYQARPLAQDLGLAVAPRSVEELQRTTEILLERANALADQVERDEQGNAIPPDFDAACQQITLEYARLGQQYPLYHTSVPRQPKQAALFGKWMPWVGIAGYYFPFTAEPIVGPTVPSHLAFNIAHEQAHALGVAPEDEAGFSAYLALSTSQDVGLQYSGAINAYIYASNALYAAAPQLASDIGGQSNENLRQDIRALNAYLAQFEGPAQDVGNAINDTYLKSQNQPAGLASYGDMVDLLIAYTLENENE